MSPIPVQGKFPQITQIDADDSNKNNVRVASFYETMRTVAGRARIGTPEKRRTPASQWIHQ